MELRLKRSSEVLFNQADHTYIYKGAELISTTQLLSKHGLAPRYDGVSAELLEKSANYGKLVHADIENYIKNNEIGLTDELQAFKLWLAVSNYKVVDSEYIVNNDIVAGTVDLLLQNLETKEYVIADIKTTSTIHTEAVSWQLSIYATLEEFEIKKAICIHIKGQDLEEVVIPLKTPNDINNLFMAEKEGKLFSYELTNIANELTKISELEKLIIAHEELVKQAKKEQETLKNAIKNEMVGRNLKTIETAFVKITLTDDYVRKTIDTKKLFKENPSLKSSDYEKESIVKGSLKITIKEGSESE